MKYLRRIRVNKNERILFVDDEPKLLQGLQRMLRSMRHEWDMAFASGGREALEMLEQTPYDVVVTDMRMPGMDGVQLMKEGDETVPDARADYPVRTDGSRGLSVVLQHCSPVSLETM